MRITFLFFVFCLMLSVHAQREVIQYTCLLTFENEQTPFYLKVGQSRSLAAKEFDVQVELKKKDKNLEISLGRSITTEDGVNGRVQKRLYPLGSKNLLVELTHAYQERVDRYELQCFPRGF